MRRHEHTRRNRPEYTPRDLADAADAYARRLYVQLADDLPGGRKMLGDYSRRVATFASNIGSPTAADWDRYCRIPGANREAVRAYFQVEAERLADVAVRDDEACVIEVVRESGEAVAAALEAQRDPSLLARGRDEVLDLYAAAGRLARSLMHAERERADTVTAARGRFGLGA